MTFERKDPYLYQQQKQGESNQRSWSSQEPVSSKFHWSSLVDSPQKIGALCLVVLVGVCVGIYTLLTPKAPADSHNDVPLIKPIHGPMKEIPTDPGGIQVPHQDKMIYQRLEARPIQDNEPAHLIPDGSDESYPPLEAQPNPPSSEAASSSSPEHANFEAWPKATPAHMAARKVPAQPPAIPAESAIPAGGPLEVAPNAAIQAPAFDPLTHTPHPAPLAEASVNTVPTQALDAAGIGAPASVSKELNTAQLPAPATPQPKVNSPAQKADGASAKALSPHSFRIQIASLSSMKAAETEKKRLWSKHKNILGRLDGKIMQVDLGNSGVRYRVVAGPVPSLKKAKELCGKLSVVKVGCIIMKPGT